MKKYTIILLFLPFIALTQTTRLEYFRSKVEQAEVILTWSTFTEDGSDMFTVIKSQDAAKWELITTLPAQEVKDGARYEVKVGEMEGVWYYKLLWKDGFSYATTTTPIKRKPSQYNIIGQKMY